MRLLVCLLVVGALGLQSAAAQAPTAQAPTERSLTELIQRLIELDSIDFPAGSMGPKAMAASRFVERTGNRAAIGALDQIEAIVDGTAGTQVVAAG